MVFPLMDVRALKRDPREELIDCEKNMPSALERGRSNNELAKELGITINTMKFYLRNLYEKLGLWNRSRAIAFDYSHGSESDRDLRV